jgi:hypothetical protein
VCSQGTVIKPSSEQLSQALPDTLNDSEVKISFIKRVSTINALKGKARPIRHYLYSSPPPASALKGPAERARLSTAAVLNSPPKERKSSRFSRKRSPSTTVMGTPPTETPGHKLSIGNEGEKGEWEEGKGSRATKPSLTPVRP